MLRLRRPNARPGLLHKPALTQGKGHPSVHPVRQKQRAGRETPEPSRDEGRGTGCDSASGSRRWGATSNPGRVCGETQQHLVEVVIEEIDIAQTSRSKVVSD